VNVGVKARLLAPVRPPTWTVTLPYELPAAVVTLRDEEFPALMIAFRCPKKTELLDAGVLKFDPEIVTVVPAGPFAGEMDVMVGVWAKPAQWTIRRRVTAMNERRI